LEGKGEMTKELIVMAGISNSGKTLGAWEIWHKLTDLCFEAAIVNRDAIRLAHYGKRYIAEREQEINAIEEAMVKAHFLYGYEIVIVDACHHTKERRERWRKIAEDNGWNIRFEVMDTPVEECIRRAEAKEDNYIIPVIQKQAAEFEPLTEEEL
jgi:predicted kinase